MSYQVLARKWRPANFEQLVGQQQTSQALRNALESQRLHHAYLFTGTRGVGKTTIARILAKSLNCEQGITATPCGQCSSCQEISQGNYVDLLEIDAASKTKVEDTRELLDNVQYRPTRGRYKVYLIDEVHMLSGHSFNALLKTLEEPPPHVVFLLATTDPQKLPVTVLSRCLQFNLRRMEEQEIVAHLSMILRSEGIEFETLALDAIARGADGSMRDALSLLDQAIAFCGGKLNQQQVLSMLGTIDRRYAIKLLDAVCSEQAPVLFDAIAEIAEFSPDYDELMAEWLSLLHQIAVAQAVGECRDAEVLTKSQTVTAADLQLFYQLSLQARRDLPFAATPRQGFEMAMLRIMTFKPASSEPSKKKVPELINPKVATSGVTAHAASPQAKYDVNLADNALKAKPDEAEGLSPHQPVVAAQAFAEPIKSESVKCDAETNAIPALREKPVSAFSPALDETLDELDSPVEQDLTELALPPDVASLKLTELTAENWHQVVEALPIDGNALQILLNAQISVENNKLYVQCLKRIEPLMTASAKSMAQQALDDYFSGAVQIEFKVVEEASETPKERQQRMHQIALDQAMERLHQDRQVSYLLEQLDGSISRDSLTIH